MTTEGKTVTSANVAHDDLQEISGIGSTYAKILYEIGICRFADLAQYKTPEELHQVLAEKAGGNIPPLSKIEKDNWLGQAKAKTRLLEAKVKDSALKKKEVEVAPLSMETSQTTWRKHAGFSVFFDYSVDEQGDRRWRTRTNHKESGQEQQFQGVEMTSWIDWILKRAKLPVSAEIRAPKVVIEEPHTAGKPELTPIKILDVEVFEAEPTFGVRRGKLMAETRFQMTGAEAKSLTANGSPYRIDIYAVNTETGVSLLVASEQHKFQPQVFEYTNRQEFPFPEVGRYELYSTIILLPPHAQMAFCKGSVINIVP